MSHPTSVTVQQLSDRDSAGRLNILDVRTPIEFRELHAENARNVPLDVLDPHTFMRDRTAESSVGEANHASNSETVYVICKAGSRGAKACQKFLDAGYTNVVNIDGGTDAWAAAGLPVVRGKKAVSIERQVRIAAGLIVLVGASAAIVTQNAWLAAIPAFVGAGLMFAGITDSCAMGMLIAKMPWNRVRDESCCNVS